MLAVNTKSGPDRVATGRHRARTKVVCPNFIAAWPIRPGNRPGSGVNSMRCPAAQQGTALAEEPCQASYPGGRYDETGHPIHRTRQPPGTEPADYPLQ